MRREWDSDGRKLRGVGLVQCGVSELNDQRHFKLDFVVMGWDMVAAGLVGQTAAAAIVGNRNNVCSLTRWASHNFSAAQLSDLRTKHPMSI